MAFNLHAERGYTMKKKIGKALVVGAGISGIRSALDLAEIGYGVTLIDHSPQMGGILTQLDYQFPTDRCGMCKMLPLVDRDASSQYCLRKGLFHENIEISLSTEMVSVEGEPGHFQVKLRQKPSWVDPERCIGCGACVPVCPVDVPDAFNAGLAPRKAIYLPVPHALPNPYVIDITACTRCGACENVCPTGAIRLSEQARKQFRILVVDDERILRDSLTAWLDDEEGFAVETAESGQEALRKLTEQPFQLMLLDIKMPGMNGVEVLKKTKDILPDLQVVMMTAYATVETAVEAMKIGALDYLTKPFDPERLIPKVLQIYEDLETTRTRQIEVGALVLSGGSAYYDPAEGKNTLGYQAVPGVVTSLEFERIISGSGPCQGRLVRPSDGRPIRKIAWVQCVGSRDLQSGADFCSNVCCMIAIKEALLAREKFGDRIETTIFYMDMRTFGKTYQRYRDAAEKIRGVRFERGRVHSVLPDAADEDSGALAVRYADAGGGVQDERFDLVVLAVGQRPVSGTTRLSETLDIPLNPWGFCQVQPFSMARTSREGVLVGGAYSGLKDISESVIQASSAALGASRIIHSAGGSLSPEASPAAASSGVDRELPRTLVVLCRCDDALSGYLSDSHLLARLENDPAVCGVELTARTCKASGWEALPGLIDRHKPNRLLIGACMPYMYVRKIKELCGGQGLEADRVEVVDIRTPALSAVAESAPLNADEIVAAMEGVLLTGLAKLKHMNPAPIATVPVNQSALVVGGGIAGMTAALAIADHGYAVDLVEQSAALGGNLTWLQTTLEGHAVRPFLDQTLERVEKHPLITVHTRTRVVGAAGRVGQFHSTIEDEDNRVDSLAHGVVILATGGREAATASYGHGQHKSVITQKALAQQLADQKLEMDGLDAVVMIQCVDSREEPKNYCSRVCCASALKHALLLKERKPDIALYILYRDMMSYGFMETYFTRARQAGVVFIQYDLKTKPAVVFPEEVKKVQVNVSDPILGRPLEIEADLLVLSTGIESTLPVDLAEMYGAALDPDGFFQEAESKWRPVDSLREGVFACGLAHSPRSIAEAVATSEAAAQRSLRILSQESLPAGKIVASVRHSICSLCERCIDACPYGARTLDEDLDKIQVNPVMCQGCGACAAVCPNSASILEGFREEQMFEIIDGVLEGVSR